METIRVCLTFDQLLDLSSGTTVTGRDQRDPSIEHTLDGHRVTGDIEAIIDGEAVPLFSDGQRIEVFVL